tara:strand:+ start:316 stop:501 length:186 start_codon:yes stop_codon:yes gene_type:complete
MHGIIRVLAQAASALAVQSGALMQQLKHHVMGVHALQEKNVPQVLVKLLVILAAPAKSADN